MLKSLLFILILIFAFSCGKNSDEQLKEAVLDAQIALGAGNCQYAIDVLEAYGRVSTNAKYVKTLASAYACRAGYSTPTFFTTDLPVTMSYVPLGGTTVYSTSEVAVANPLQDDLVFNDLQTAINILLYAGGIASPTEPTATERAKHFSSDEAGDINSQLLFMELVQLGKYMRVYGNGIGTGVNKGKKGFGTYGNTCFTSYDSATQNIKDYLADPLRAAFKCTATNSSHPQLQGPVGASAGITPATRKTRMCQGVVLLNGVFNLLPSVLGAATGGSLSDISTLTDSITFLQNALIGVEPLLGSAFTPILTTVSQAKCEDDAVVTVPQIEGYFAGMMENVFL
jgi:hypothetical protein